MVFTFIFISRNTRIVFILTLTYYFLSFPSLRVGMQFVTLCVTGRRASLHEFPRRPRELLVSYDFLKHLKPGKVYFQTIEAVEELQNI